MSFLAGQSEMAKLIRTHDWQNHPLGRPESWPQVLRSALGICLNSAFPTAIYWGSDLRLLYNDAWSAIPGPRHPACLGAPAQEVWSDIWHIIEPQFHQVIESGEGISLEDQLLPMRRYGFEEETYWNYSFTPIRGEDGAIVGVFNSGNEATHKVLQARQTRFLLSLSDTLRDCASGEETMDAACAALGRHLGLIRVGIRGPVRESDRDAHPVSAEWTAPDVTPIGKTLPLDRLGSIAESLRAGRVARINSIDTLTDPDARELLHKTGVAATLSVPWVVNRALSASLFLHSAQERNWTDEEVATAEQVLERTLNAVEREQARAREQAMAHEIDHRARNLLAVVRAVARLVQAPDVAQYRENLLERLEALSTTHSLLSESRWNGVSLRNVLEQELAPYRGAKGTEVMLEGPDLVLSSEMAQALSMAFHELATNAAKHGALGAGGGTLDIRWTLPEAHTLDIAWRETRRGHAPAPAHGTGSGFGTRLLAMMIGNQLGGAVDQGVTESGFFCDMQVPLSPRPTSSETAAALPAADSTAERRVLVVEDDPLVAMDLADTLAELGYQPVGLSRTVAAALAAIDEYRPNLAVMDLRLGTESAAPVGQALAAREIPFLVISGYEPDKSSPDLATRPRIIKPFSRHDLEQRLAQISEGARDTA